MPASLPPEIVEATEPPDPITVEDVLERLEAVHRALGNAPPKSGDLTRDVDSLREPDGLSSFNYLYTVITAEIKKRLDDGKFADPVFLTLLDVTFAKRYLNALRTYALGNIAETPACWRTIIEHRDDPHIASMQFAIAGVNAHVNYDLPFAVVETCERQGTALGSGTQHDDFDRVNEVFYDRIPALREHFEEDVERFLDRGFVRAALNLFDDALVTVDRTAAWLEAEDLWRLDKGQRDQEEKRLDRFVALGNRGILRFG
jgi:hypothetical protein